MEALKATRQAPSPCCCSFMPDLGGISRLDLFVGVRGGGLKCGFGTCVDPLLLVGICSFPSPCAGCLPSSSAASSRIVGFGFQSLMENWKFGGFKFDGCCPSSKLQNLRCLLVAVSFSWMNSDLNLDMMCSFYLCSHDAWIHFGSCMWNFKGLMVLRSFFHGNIAGQCSFVIYILELDSDGIKCVSSVCFFCILEMRADDDLAKDGDSCSCGLIHQWQVREPLFLIPRFYEQESFRLSSVMHLRDLQLIHLLPLVHMPVRLSGESLTLWRACTKEVFEDFSCGCALDLARHKTPVVVFPIFSLILVVLVFRVCKVAPIYALLSRVL